MSGSDLVELLKGKYQFHVCETQAKEPQSHLLDDGRFEVVACLFTEHGRIAGKLFLAEIDAGENTLLIGWHLNTLRAGSALFSSPDKNASHFIGRATEDGGFDVFDDFRTSLESDGFPIKGTIPHYVLSFENRPPSGEKVFEFAFTGTAEARKHIESCLGVICASQTLGGEGRYKEALECACEGHDTVFLQFPIREVNGQCNVKAGYSGLNLWSLTSSSLNGLVEKIKREFGLRPEYHKDHDGNDQLTLWLDPKGSTAIPAVICGIAVRDGLFVLDTYTWCYDSIDNVLFKGKNLVE